MSVTRDELHRLIDEVPSDELDRAGEYLRRLVGDRRPARRRFRSMSVFSGPSELAARSKDILGDEPGRTR